MMLFGRAPIMTIDSVRKMTSPTGWIRHRVTGTVGEAPTSRTFRLVQRLSHLWRSLGNCHALQYQALTLTDVPYWRDPVLIGSRAVTDARTRTSSTMAGR